MNKIIGNYVIHTDQFLGSGNFGQVFKASSYPDGKNKYAVKIIPR
jgi:hypothetical protein